MTSTAWRSVNAHHGAPWWALQAPPGLVHVEVGGQVDIFGQNS
jgi:hypothetical protein